MGTRVADVADSPLLGKNHLGIINQSKECDLARCCLLLSCCRNILSLFDNCQRVLDQWEHFLFDRYGRWKKRLATHSYNFIVTRLRKEDEETFPGVAASNEKCPSNSGKENLKADVYNYLKKVKVMKTSLTHRFPVTQILFFI